MIISAVAALAVASLGSEAQPKITAVSMFKNGYSFIARQTDVAASGVYTVEQPPQAAHGTYWHLPSDGIAITRTASTTVESSSNSAVESLEGLLSQNTGKQVTIDFDDQPTITGKLLPSIGDLLVIQTGDGTVFVNRGRIKRLQFRDQPKMDTPVKSSKRVMQLTVDAKRPGTITTVGLEHGLAWVPAYAVDVSDKKEVQVVAKATIVNELADLDNVEASFITGFPNIRYAGISDPLTNPAALDQLLAMLVSGSFSYGQANITSQMARRGAEAAPAMDKDFTGGFIPQGTGDQVEDLFFYKLTGITLKKGDRAAYTLFTFKAPYEHLFTWNVTRPAIYGRVARQDDQDVWHSLVFKNTSGKPLTTAVASVFADNQILGQDVMTYTSAGAETNVQLNKAMDIHPSSMEEETVRDRAALQLPGGSTYDLITVKGTLAMRNDRTESAKMRVTTSFDGDLVSADEHPKTVKGAKNLGDLNPTTSLEWRPEVGAGKTLTLTYTYRLYMRTP